MYAVAGLAFEAEIEETHENAGASLMFGATFRHVLPPSRVTCTLPSSVPAQITLASRGLSAMEMMVQWNSARVLSFEMSPPLAICLDFSLVERSGLMIVHVSPRSVVLKSTLPP